MKRLFKDKKPQWEGVPFSYSLTSCNFDNLPNITVVHNRDEGVMADAFRGLPNLPFGLVVVHCYSSPTPAQVTMLYELHRISIKDETPILLFHHKKGMAMKKWRLAMRLMDFVPLNFDEPISVWNAPRNFKKLRCKTTVALEEQPSKFYRGLLQGTKRVLEVFPRVGAVSKTALALGIPVTVFISGEDANTKDLVQRLGGSF